MCRVSVSVSMLESKQWLLAGLAALGVLQGAGQRLGVAERDDRLDGDGGCWIRVAGRERR
ncbi:hypothetical protein CSH63_21875 [Micromonospora tulbaghiae]|uniref:Uncharacterized protein n=1 Tax=Micromonospora tulbaghiae TaxID=479978 RepID=A0A386WNT9_9ACTN|nr:hypothetical protein CSH63_21875 [Micromonospora tulbaghiae]